MHRHIRNAVGQCLSVIGCIRGGGARRTRQVHRLSHHHLGHLVFHHERREPVQIGRRSWPAGASRADSRACRWGPTAPGRPGRFRRRRPSPGRLGRGPLAAAAAPSGAAATRRDRSISLVSFDTGGKPALTVDLGRRVVRRLRRGARPGRAGRPAARGAARRPGRCPRGCTRSRVLGSRHAGHLPLAAATACSPACNAAGIPAGSVPPPWATSALPPPRPPTGAGGRLQHVVGRQSALDGDRVQRRHESHLATGLATPAAPPPAVGRQPAPDVEREGAQVATAEPGRRAGDQRRRRPTSVAPAASCPAAARVCCPRSSASSLSTSRSRASMPLTRSTRPSCGVLSSSASWRTRSRSRAR